MKGRLARSREYSGKEKIVWTRYMQFKLWESST